MSAGDSAGAEARRQLALANAHIDAAAAARAAAARYSVAETTERRTAAALAPLSAVGHHLLADRRWPGSRRAQVDLVVVGPGGVFIVDTKAWRDVSIHGGRIYRGQGDVTDELVALRDLVLTAQADLAEIGLAPGEVHAVVVLAGRKQVHAELGGVCVVGERDVLRHIASRGTRLTPRQVDAVLGRALSLFAQVGEPAPVLATVPEPVLPPPAETDVSALLTEAEVHAALLDGILAAPIEEWMSFLHPHQAKLVRRSFNGPARIRGSAGTGKTVVGLHRAAYLARTRPGRVLVATFVRTLPVVLRQLMHRMAPDVADRVDFSGVHAFALDVLKERGVHIDLNPTRAANAFEVAWQMVGRSGPLGNSALPRVYWEEEIASVIKGRGITQFVEYADLARTGRRHRLTVEQRRAVWELHGAYHHQLARLGVHDYADVILMAERELRREPLGNRYSAVIVDEAQDLSCAMVRMLHGIVGDAVDGLTLIGDGQQSIYPGGYTLAEAGISLSGRGVVMEVNYRNTAQVVAFAQRMIAGDEFADIEGATAPGDVPRTVTRFGPEPVVEACADWADRYRRMVERVEHVTNQVGVDLGDVGVLCASRAAAARAADALQAAGRRVVMLDDYDGGTSRAVKVGTIKRAKGLEFKHVLMPDVRSDQMGEREPPQDGAERERWERQRRELYVAMTRARDGLWIGVV